MSLFSNFMSSAGDKIKKVGSKVTGAAQKFSGNGSFRTGVLNDFSQVSKANFYILKRVLNDNNEVMVANGSTDLSSSVAQYALECKLPVQINPSSIHFDFGSDIRADHRKGISIGSAGGIDQIVMPHDRTHDTLNINLTYDIYDEYYTRTLNGLTGGIVSSQDRFSLMSETATSIQKLGSYAGNTGGPQNDYHVLFLWGEIEFFGLLTRFSGDYSAFSQWGEPLKAEASLEILKQPLGYNQKTGLEVSPLRSGALHLSGLTDDLASSINKSSKASNALNRVALGISQALR